MMKSLLLPVSVSFFAVQTWAFNAVSGSNSSNLRLKAIQETSYGKDPCPCVGIDNLKGYYATQENYYHVQRPVEAGASCEAWDEGKHPACRESLPPQWCAQSWCYVDPCNCKLPVTPKKSSAGVTYQGSPAYWSYNTCGGLDYYTREVAPEACVLQKTAGDCSKNSKCGWDGKQCMGVEALQACKSSSAKDAGLYGQEDCRCIGLGGRDTGKAFMYINEQELINYPTDVGATCKAWEEESHPECQKDGVKPSWCSAKWCFVDPCKCSTAIPPKTVMGSNKQMRFQGKTAYWSYLTCGSKDTWTDANSGKYCIHHKSEDVCAKADGGSRCAWNGKECLGKALVEICEKQRATGVLGMESPLQSGAHIGKLVVTFLVMISAIATV